MSETPMMTNTAKTLKYPLIHRCSLSAFTQIRGQDELSMRKMLQLGPVDAHVSPASRIAGRSHDIGAGKAEEEVGIDELQRILLY